MADFSNAAAWRHLGSREGFEFLFPRREANGHRFEGQATGIESIAAWTVHYALSVDARWLTRAARITGLSASGEHGLTLEGDGAGAWRLDGEPAPALDGCLEVDLEASAFTNAIPVRRLALDVGESAEAPAAWVRIPDLRVERLEQTYTRLEDDAGHAHYDYSAPELGFKTVIVYDETGLVLDYPGIAARVA